MTPHHGCGCPDQPHRRILNPAAHAAWHALVVEQGGPAGEVNAQTLRAARGFSTPTPASETVLDVRARATGRRASGALREASR
jgi:hypothetical protein